MWQAACLFACFAVTLGCGTMYAYSAYAPQLSDRLHLSASEISSIGIIGNLSMSLSGPFVGILVDNIGFTIPILISIVCSFLGYLIVLTAYTNEISSIPLLAFALFLIGTASTCAFSASVKCAAINFPKIRGSATACTMSGYGLSAFAMSLLSQVTSSFALSQETAEQVPNDTAKHILTILTIVPTALMCLFGPIVIQNQPKNPATSRNPLGEYELEPTSDLLIDRISQRVPQEKDVYGIFLLQTPIFWLYFTILGLLAGMGQAYIYTCGYMVKSLTAVELNAPEINQEIVVRIQAYQVAILSLANCTGRILSGTISDTLKSKFRVSRLNGLFLGTALCFAGNISILRQIDVHSLWISTVLTGLFYGFVFGTYPGVISDAFGVKRLSSNWGLVALAPIPFSSYLAIRVGKIYDKNSNSGICVGPQCFQGAYHLHLVLTLVVFLLLVIAIRVERRTRTRHS